MPPAIVHGRDGLRGVVIERKSTGTTPGPEVDIRLDDGRLVELPAALLRRRDDGDYDLDLSAADLPGTGASEVAGTRPDLESDGADLIVPVVAEEVQVGKRRVVTGRIVVRKTVHVDEQIVAEKTYREEADVTRVPVGRMVDAAVPTRHEGDLTIIPLYEEVIVVEKRLRLREELHIRTRRVEETKPERVTVRREEVEVERIPGAGTASRPASGT